ncbi:MAG: elongation factor Ts [Bacilli bacterium]|nr:elongation factor Ts [Bacilli bacterium]
MMVTAEMVKNLREATGAGMMDCKKALAECNGDMDAAVNYLREKGIAKANKKESRVAAEGLANIFVDGNKAVILEVNSETDFVSKNEEFQNLIVEIGKTILSGNATTMEEAMALSTSEGTIQELIVAKTAKIGEKLSFRRFVVLTKEENEVFGSYLHLGGRIAALSKISNTTEDIAKDVSMQAAAMNPRYVFRSEVPESVVQEEKEILKEQAMNEGKSEDIAIKMVDGRLNKFFKEICLAEQAFIKDSDFDVATYVKNHGGEIKEVIRYEVGEGIEKKQEDFAAEVMNQVKGN